MIKVSCREEKFRYTAYHLTKAFLPDDQVESVLCPDQPELILVSSANDHILAAVGDTGSKESAERELYRQLKLTCKKELPWGTLTGIRPTKLATRMLNTMDEDSFFEWIAKERLVSPEKARLAWNIAKLEEKIIRQAGAGWSLYINIPVCPTRCSYCSFSLGLLKDWAPKMDDYIEALVTELSEISKKIPDEIKDSPALRKNPSTIYIGGGTPTVLNEKQLEKLLGAINRHFSGYSEFTLEAGRPDTITRDKLKIAKSMGVNRISINPQTMQQKTLDLVGRGHTVGQVAEAFVMAREAGFSNINMDLIAGLPGETVKDFSDTLKQISGLSPDSLTIHALSIKRKAGLNEKSAGRETPPDYARTVSEMIDMGASFAGSANLFPYYLYRQKSIAGNFENVGYSKEGSEGIFNVLTMEEVQSIIGIGAGAASKFLTDEPVPDPMRGPGHETRILHSINEADIALYIGRHLKS